MKTFLLAIFLFLTLMCYGQEKMKGFIDLSQNFNYRLNIPLKGFTNTKSNLTFGIDYKLTNTSISAFGTYAYGGVVNYTNFPTFHNSFSAYQLDYHLMGGGIKLRFRGRERLYSPTFKVIFLTEIASKYRGGKIIASVSENREVYFSPTDRIYKSKKPSSNGTGGSITPHYYTFNYISTPLIGVFYLGNEFKVTDNLNINIGIGYLFRAFRFYKNEWGLSETEPKVGIIQTHSLKETNYGEIEIEGYLEFEFGLSYFFSFKSKKQ